MQNRFYTALTFFFISFSACLSQECSHPHIDTENAEEIMSNYHKNIQSLLDSHSHLRKSGSSQLNIPLNFYFFYNPGTAIVPEQEIKETIDRTNEILELSVSTPNCYRLTKLLYKCHW